MILFDHVYITDVVSRLVKHIGFPKCPLSDSDTILIYAFLLQLLGQHCDPCGGTRKVVALLPELFVPRGVHTLPCRDSGRNGIVKA